MNKLVACHFGKPINTSMFQIRQETCPEVANSSTNDTSNATDYNLANEAVSAFILDPRWRLRFSPFDEESAWNTLQGSAKHSLYIHKSIIH